MANNLNSTDEAIVEVRPVPQEIRQPWDGPEDRDFTSPKVIEVLYDPRTGSYATGLTEEETEEYSKKLGVDLSSKFDPDKPHSYWSNPAAWIRLPNTTMILNLTNPRDYVKWKNLRASKFVANSITEWQKGLWPEATHVLYDERENAAFLASKIQLKQTAYVELSKFSAEQKRELFEAITHRSGKGHNMDTLDVQLSRIIEGEVESPDINTLLRHIKMDEKERATRSLIVRGLEAFILRTEGPAIFYLDSQLGFDFDDTVRYFLDVNNQGMKLLIMEKIQAGSTSAVNKLEDAVKNTEPVKAKLSDLKEELSTQQEAPKATAAPKKKDE